MNGIFLASRSLLFFLLLLHQIFALQQIKETFTTMNPGTEIYGIGFGNGNTIFYESSKGSNGSTKISRYQLKSTSRTLTSSFQPKLNTVKYNKVFQVNSKYTVIYSTEGNSSIQIYTTKDKFVNLRQYNESISSVFYSKGRDKVFIFKKSGQVVWMDFGVFITPNSNTSETLIRLNQTVQGHLSTDSNYLALRKLDSSYLCVIDLDTYKIVYQTHKQMSINTRVAWDQSSEFLLVYDSFLGYLQFVDILNVKNETLNDISAMSLKELQNLEMMMHLQTNQLLIVYRKAGQVKRYYIDAYRIGDWQLTYRLNVDCLGQTMGLVVSEKDPESVYSFVAIDQGMSQKFGTIRAKKSSTGSISGSFATSASTVTQNTNTNTNTSSPSTNLTAQSSPTNATASSSSNTTTSNPTNQTSSYANETNSTISSNTTEISLPQNQTLANSSTLQPNTPVQSSNSTQLSPNSTDSIDKFSEIKTNETSANNLINETLQTNDTSIINQTVSTNQTTPINQSLSAPQSSNTSSSQNLSTNQSKIENTQNLTTQNPPNNTEHKDNSKSENFTVPHDNSTLDLQSPAIVYQPYTSFFINAMNSTAFKSMNKLPGSRKLLKPFFSFFSNLDDLWLYYYHERNYDQSLQRTFQTIRNMQQEKWQLIPIQQIYQNWLKLDFQFLKLRIDQYKDKFTSVKYLELQDHSVGFLFNSLDFMTTNLIILTFIFLLGKIIHKLLARFNFSLASSFNQFTLWLYFLFMCLDGNIQFFSYLIGFQMNTISYQTPLEKILSVIVLTFSFFFIFVIVALPYLSLWFYRQKAQVLYDNCRSTQLGIFYISLNFGLRNLFLGMIHIFLRNLYETKILALLGTQILFLFANVIYISLRKNNSFFQKFNPWINVLGSFIRILIVFSFSIQRDIEKQDNYPVYRSLYFSQYYQLLLSCNMSLWVLCMLHELFSIFYEGIYYLKQKIIQRQAKQTKQEQKLQDQQQIRVLRRNQNLSKNPKAIRVSRIAPNAMLINRLTQHDKNKSRFCETKPLLSKDDDEKNKVTQNDKINEQSEIGTEMIDQDHEVKPMQSVCNELQRSSIYSQSNQNCFLNSQKQQSQIDVCLQKSIQQQQLRSDPENFGAKNVIPRYSRRPKIPIHIRNSKCQSQIPLQIFNTISTQQDTIQQQTESNFSQA